jgi:hypothetical protein
MKNGAQIVITAYIYRALKIYCILGEILMHIFEIFDHNTLVFIPPTDTQVPYHVYEQPDLFFKRL